MSNKKRIAVLALLLACGGFLAFRWQMNKAKQLAELRSFRSLLEVGQAFLWYADAGKDQVLPAYSLDSTGKPGLSWRVLLLPYMGELELYKKFRLDEPWDSPANTQLVEQLPAIYRSQFCNKNEAGFTSFVVVVDAGGAFPPVIEGQPLSFADIKDGLSNTLLALEIPEAPQIWTKPDSLTLEDVSSILKKRNSGQRLHMSFLDGSVTKFESYVGDKTLNAFCTRAGDDIVHPESVPGAIPF